MNQKFPKINRLLTRKEFEALKGRGQRYVGTCLCVDVNPSANPKLGITASKKYGCAVERNRFKRLVREAYRRHPSPALTLHVVPRQRAKQAKLADIEKELLYAQRTPT